MATFDRLADLPLEIEGYELQGQEFTTGSFERLSTTIHIWGGGEDGLGEDVTYDAVDHIALRDAGAALDLTGHATLGEFCEFMGGVDTFPAEPQRDVSRRYRRWAFESAALDLALRQSGIGHRRGARPRAAPGHLRLLDGALAGRGKALDDRDPAAQARPLPRPALQARRRHRLGRRADRRSWSRPARSTRST